VSWRIGFAVLGVLILAALLWNASELHYRNCLADNGGWSPYPPLSAGKDGKVVMYARKNCSRLP
jgi:hypothetical protein